MSPTGSRRRGHRILPHTADVIVEAWGPDMAACAEEAVTALVETYASPMTAVPVVSECPVHVAAAPDDQMLLALLEEVIFVLDTADGVPIGARVASASGGGLDARLVLTKVDAIEAGGAVPKAISRSGLLVTRDRDGARCRFLVDV